MLRRLLLAILVACLAVPAVAGPWHSASASTPLMSMASASDCHHKSSPAKPAACQDECIGCVAPYAAAPMLPEPAKLGAIAAVQRGQVQIAGLDPGPETPPPRS